MIQYAVCRGVYPFNEQIATVTAPSDQPEKALETALDLYMHHVIDDPHPVVAPINPQ